MRTKLTITIAMVMAFLLAWQHVNGGVPAHHLLADPSRPALSNWWGLLTLPLLAWFLLGRIDARRVADPAAVPRMQLAFGGALLYGAALATLFTASHASVTDSMALAIFVLALFLPVYRAEYVLGFVIGMTWSFGAILPMIAAAVFAAAGAVIHLGVRFLYSRALLLRR
jgi:hypothetical protein